MKKLLLSTVALASLTASAMAADLPSRRVAPAPFVAVPVFTWTGFYIGANAGYGFSDSSDRNFNFGNGAGLLAVGPTGIVNPVVPAAASGIFGNNGGFGNRERDGFVGGGQIGYNYQIGQFVIGVEADIQYTDFNSGRNNGGGIFDTAVPAFPNIALPVAGSPGNVAFFNNNGSNRSDYFGTVRGRLGFAFDRMLVYGTGGVAFRDTGDRSDVIAPNFFIPAVGGGGIGVVANQERAEDTGYAVGGGIEYAFTPNITAKIEGLYVNFDSDDRGRANTFRPGQIVGVTNTGADIVATAGTRRSREDDFAVVRAGINYKFNLF